MSKKILIVDDSESIREVVAFTLESEGHIIITAGDGKEALSKLDGNVFDLIITDLHMPVMDGIVFIQEVRKIESYLRVPILFLTTESQLNKKEEAKAAGATGWIIKPFVPAKLIAAINKVIR